MDQIFVSGPWEPGAAEGLGRGRGTGHDHRRHVARGEGGAGARREDGRGQRPGGVHTYIWSIGPFVGPFIGSLVHSFVHSRPHA